MKRVVLVLLVWSGVLIAQPVEGLPVTGRMTTRSSQHGIPPTVEYFYRSIEGSTLRVQYKGDQESGEPWQGSLWDAKARKFYRIDYVGRTYSYFPHSVPAGSPLQASRNVMAGEPFRDVVNGVPCVLYPRIPVELTESSTCYSDKLGVVVRSKSTRHAKRGDSVSTMEMSDLRVDTIRDPSFFQIPAGFTEVASPRRRF